MRRRFALTTATNVAVVGALILFISLVRPIGADETVPGPEPATDGLTAVDLAFAEQAFALASVDTDPIDDDGFEINLGQLPDGVDAAVRLAGRSVSLIDGHAFIDTPGPDRGNVVSIGLVGADPAVAPEPLGEPVTARTNYFVGDQAITGVAHHPDVLYRDLVPGVDVHYVAERSGLTYDLLLAAGVDPATVSLAAAGVANVSIDPTGRLVLGQEVGPPLRFSAPVSFQVAVDGARIDRPSRYVINPDGTIGVQVDEWDPTLPVVIDPTLDLGSYLGGANADQGASVGIDSSGNIVVAGRADSTDFPTTAGAYDTTDNPLGDVVVSKLSADGTTLLWSTYLGGSGDDYPGALDVDASGRLLVVGTTGSTDFPTPGGYDTSYNNNLDGFVARLSSDGASLDYATYVGGGLDDQLVAVDHDASGTITVGGYSTSTDYPVTGGAYDTTHNGNWDMVATRFTSGGALAWSTYYGGSGADRARDLVVGSDGRVRLSATTASSDLPTTAGAYDTTANGADDAAYLELGADGSTLDYATYFGGSGADEGWSLDLVSSTSVILAGETASADLPTTAGVLDTTHNGGSDVFVARLDRSQTGTASLAWSTYFGGAGTDRATGVAVDAYGRPHVSMTTGSSGLATAGAPDTTLSGTDDAMVLALAVNGAGAEFATYYGGGGSETAGGIILDGQRRPVIAGATSSTDLTTSAGAYDTTLGGTWDLFAARFTALPASAASYYDDFPTAAVDGSTGTLDWSITPWIEQGEADGLTSGEARIVTGAGCTSGSCLRIGALDSSVTEHGWARPVDLSGATSASLSLDVATTGTGSGGGLAIEVSDDGGATWNTLETASTTGNKVHDITAWANPTTWIRVVGSGDIVGEKSFLVDNVAVDADTTGGNTFVVNSTADVVDLTPGDGTCDTGNTVGADPECTVRAAIIEANALAGAQTIVVPAGTYPLTLTGTAENASASGDLDIAADTVIIGAGVDGTVIDAGDAFRVLDIVGGTTAAHGLTLTGGALTGSDDGAGLRVASSATMTGRRLLITANSGLDHGGGVDVADTGTLVLYDSEISANTAPYGAGFANAGSTTMERVLVTGNNGDYGGGGRVDNGTLNLTNVTFSANSASVQGGAFQSVDTVTMVNVTVTGNSAGTRTGGVHEGNGSAATAMVNSIVAGNTAPATPDVSGSIASGGFNIIGTADGTGWVAGDQLSTDPLLGPLADNGGSTRTHAVPAASPAVDAGTATGAPSVDQRVEGRDGSPDIGAYEYRACADADGDGLSDCYEQPIGDSDGDTTPNYLDADDDDDGTLTADENADPNGDGDGRDALDTDRDRQPDYLDSEAGPSQTPVDSFVKISDTSGGLNAVLDDADVFGQGTTALGDIDGDGVNDLAVSAFFDDDGGTSRGAVYVLFLNPDGSVKAEQKISSTVGGLTGPIDNTDYFGRSVAGLGDIDGDGIGDLAVGSAQDDDGGSNRGAVYILFLNSNGTVKAEQKISDTTGGLNAALDNGDAFGISAGSIGDLDGDGINDLAVGANGDDDGGPDRGSLYLLFLNADGTVKAEQKVSDTAGGLTVTLDDSDLFGYTVDAIGDLDGDGTTELAVGAVYDDDGGSNRGAVYILFMNTDGTVKAEQKISDLVGGFDETLTDGGEFGRVSGLGDLDGDGINDLIIGAPAHFDGGPSRGAVFLVLLRADGTVKSEQKISDTAGDFTATLSDNEWFGTGVTTLGDLDGDGVLEVAVGAALDNDGGLSRGAVFVIHLTDVCDDSDGDGLTDCQEDANTDADNDPATNPGPDTDGDTTPNYLDADDDGDGIPTAAENADPNDDGDTRDALDTDHDGQPDYLDVDAGPSNVPIAAEQKISDLQGGLAAVLDDDDEFGFSVATIGDVDGDGVTDVAVGAHTDDDGGTNRGAVYILFLNSNGTVKGEQKISSTTGGLTGPIDDDDRFGVSVDTVGDVDGDGVPDLVVGAHADDDGGADRGAAYILFLNSNGTVKGEQKISDTTGGLTGTIDNGDNFGSGVTGLGDLNGDGVPDLAVGVDYDDDGGTDRGAVYILFLNTDGTVRGEQKISDTAGGLVAVLDDGDNLGRSIGDLGDVDGDGVVDLGAMAYRDDDGATNRGALYILFLNADGTVKDNQKISSLFGGLTLPVSDLGSDVVGLGDINGDGIPDLAVGGMYDDDGSQDRGAVFLLSLNADGTVKNNTKISNDAGGLTGPLETYDNFGSGVSSLGDLDGDGTLNIVIGARGDDDGGPSRGALYVLDLTADSCQPDADGDGVSDCWEDADPDADGDPATNPGPDTDGDTTPNYLDADDDGDGTPTASENADPNGDGDPRDGIDTDGDGQLDYLDSEAGPSTTPVASEQKISDTEGGLVGALIDGDIFGEGVAPLGDLDGDGVVDIAVGASGDNADRGAVYVLFLNADGTVKAEQKISPTSGGFTGTLAIGDQFGYDVGVVGDLDGDGNSEIVVGAVGTEDGGTDRGAVYILFLNVDGTVKAHQKISSTTGGLTGPLVDQEWFGWAADGIGDLDGDGVNDVAVGAPRNDDGAADAGAVYILFLNRNGTVKAEQKISNAAGGLGPTLAANDRFGVSIAGFGDVDDDGTPDVAVGAYGDNDGGGDYAGAVYILSLNANGTVKTKQKISATTGGLSARLGNEDLFGASVGTVGDLNGDGVPDLIVGAQYDYDGGVRSGALYQLNLNADGTVKHTRKISATVGGLQNGPTDNDYFGVALTGLGDLDGDGTLNIAVGAGNADGAGTDRGALYMLDLSVDLCPADTDNDGILDCYEDTNTDADNDPATNPGPDTDSDGTPNYLDTDDDGDATPTALENADPNGDGYPLDANDSDRDGQPDYLDPPFVASQAPVVTEQKISDTAGGLVASLDNGAQFGGSSTAIGDIDGDGVVDMAVGVPKDPLGGTEAGAVFVLLMNSDGTVKAEQKIGAATGGLTATIDAFDQFGISVAGLGDVDGDGIVDLAVGADGDDDGGNGRGAAYVLFLNSDGTVRAEQKISDTAGGFVTLLGDNDRFGFAVSTIGDVDYDGVPDVAVGAFRDDDGGVDRGAAYVLFLNSDGTVRAEQKISDTAGGFVTLLGDNDFFGSALTGVGDIDGDGVPDLAIGARDDDDGGNARGAVYVVRLNPDGTVKGEQKLSDTAGYFTPALIDGARFGWSVSGVGDLNDDGVPDLAVGAPGDGDGGAERGAVYLVYLNATGQSKAAQKISDTQGGFTATLDNVDGLGRSVAGLGDLDGDGTIGLVMGADGDDDGGTDRGAVYVVDLTAGSVVLQDFVTVNSTGTAADSNPGDGVCTTGGTNSQGAPACTLRAAIAETNASGVLKVIKFNMPTTETGYSAGVWTITPPSTLPAITTDTTVDATTQPGWTTTPVVRINGSSAGVGGDGLQTSAASSGATIRGFAIGGFQSNAIQLEGTNHTVVGNHLGVNPAGTAIAANSGSAVYLKGGSGLVIGGSTPADRNIISGSANGIVADLSSLTGATISGNYIGTDVTGLVALANTFDGIRFQNGATGAVIGGPTPAHGNVIAASGDQGIQLSDAGAGNTVLSNNVIGLGSDRSTPLPNTQPALYVQNADGVEITDNLIGNALVGIQLESADNAVIQGNTIGTDDSGTGNHGFDQHGVLIQSGSLNALVGGVNPGDGNVIANAGLGGSFRAAVSIDLNATNNAILGNTIVNNRGIGIDHESGTVEGPNTNDAGDADTGSNDQLNWPVLTSADDLGGGSVSITYNLDVPAGNYRIEFFTNPSGDDTTGYGEGEVLIGTQSITHPGGGSAPFATTVSGGPGTVVTATATEDLGGGTYGSTSEFGRNLAVVGCVDSDEDGDGLCSPYEDADLDVDGDYTTSPTPDTDGDGSANYLDADDDGDGVTTASENADPNGDANPRDAIDSDRDGEPDYLDLPTLSLLGKVKNERKISDLAGGFTTTLDNGDFFGNAVSAIGDLDLDGVTDMAVGAFKDDDGAIEAGALYILLMNPDGTVKAEQKISNTAGGLAAAGVSLDAGDWFGESVTAVGDLDDDGINELAVGASQDDDGNTNRGAAYILFLHRDGTVRAAQKISDTAGGLQATLQSRFGRGLSALGDVDGDGRADLAVGEHDYGTGAETGSGRVHILFLNADGTVRDEQQLADGVGGKIANLPRDAAFGFDLGGLGDIDADGTPDLAVGAYMDDAFVTDSGALYVLRLNPDGTVKGESRFAPTDLASADDFTWAVAGIGDIDGDGIPDVTASSLTDDDGSTDQGAVYLFTLNADGTRKGQYKISETVGNFNGAMPPLRFGSALSSIGDFDGDGAVDIAIGAYQDADGGTDRGAVWITYLAGHTVTVNSTGDAADSNIGDGLCQTGGTNSQGKPACTLRAAIAEANAHALVDTISFDLPTTEAGYSTGVWTIAPGSDLPAITAQVSVDATTQAGYSSTPIVALDGTAATGNGLDVDGDSSVVRGLSIHSFPLDGVEIGAASVTVVGNLIGLLADGTTAAGNGAMGIDVRGVSAIVGGPDPADRNVIAASGVDQMQISVTGAGAVVEGNYFGTDVSGLLDRGNVAGHGIDVEAGATIRDNVIAAADINGIQVDIDTVAIVGNLIGVGADGTTPLPNSGDGIEVGAGATQVTIGGTASADANLIAGNTGDGVAVSGPTTVLGNSIVGNGGLGIDLAADGVTANDPGDADTGPNGLLNHPEISVLENGGTVDATVDLDVPAGNYLLQFYNNTEADPSGYGEGETLRYSSTVYHDGSGVKTFNLTIPGQLGEVITVTATESLGGGSYGATSEFSNAVTVRADTDGDGLWDDVEDADTDADLDPMTTPGPDTDGDTFANYNDADDDGDGIPTASENADPNGDGEPRDALDIDRDGQPDYLDPPTAATGANVVDEQKISDLYGGFNGILDNSDRFGYAMTGIGDLDGDGINDLVVGADQDDDGGTDRGALYVLFMNGDGTVKGEQKISDTVGGLAAVLDDVDNFGMRVTALGDLDGDGVIDLAVGAYGDDDGGADRGAAYVLFMNADGTVKGEQKISDTVGGLAAVLDDGDRFGSAIGALGDLDGDGLPDMVVGAQGDDDGGTDRGAAYVLFLNADGTVKGEQKISDTVGGLAAVLDNSDLFGVAAHGIGDVDGDGLPDVALSSYGDDDGGTDRGAVFVLFLNADGTVKGEQKISDTAGGFTSVLDNSDHFGQAVTGVGDLDLDGVPDLVVGVRADDDGGTDRGAVYVLFLNADGTVKIEQKISDLVSSLATPLENLDYFGVSVAAIGDLDGDGTIGLAVGASGDDDGGSYRGAVYILDLSGFNNAPVLDNTGTMTLDPITEDDFTNAGNTVAEIVASAGGDRITDADGDPEGIQIVSFTVGDGGWWEFSLDAGTTWTRVTTINQTLGLRATDVIRYVPSGFKGATPTLTIRAWDQTQGSAGLANRYTGSGGTTAYSAATETVSITVTDVNDLPTFGTPSQVGVAGGDNIVLWDDDGRYEYLQAVAEDANGRFVAAGYVDTAAAPGNDEVLVVRFSADGSIDDSFGTNGRVVVPIGADDDRAWDVAVQADGKIVVGGSYSAATTDGFVLRLNADGTIDTGYGGGDGIVGLDLGGAEVFEAIGIQSNGTVVAAGQTGSSLIAARFDTSGVLDSSYGTSGVAQLPAFAGATGLDVQTDDKVVVSVTVTNTVSEFGLVRLNTNGSVDTSFGGGDGVVSTDLGVTAGYNAPTSVAISPDGSIVVGGQSIQTLPDGLDMRGTMAAARFSAAGVLDTTFGGGNGYVRTELESSAYDGATSVDVAADGSVVLGGHLDLAYKGQSDTVVVRYLANGTLDSSFDGDGVALTRTSRFWNTIEDVAVTSSGDIVAVGSADVDALFLRYSGTTGAALVSPPTNALDATPTYATYSPAVVMDGDVRAYDQDLVDLSSWAGTWLTVTRQGGASANDVFSAGGIVDPLVESGSVVVDGVDIGTVTTNSAGTLRLDFTANATEARVNRVLRALTYANSTTETGTVTMAWTFDDGTGATANGTVPIQLVMVTATVNSTGDASDLTPGDNVCDTGATNSEGDPECTLRAAIEELNTFGGAINFAIPTSDPGHAAGVWTITPGSDLPAIVTTVDLDATTQTGWTSWTPVVAIDGTGATQTQGLLSVGAGAADARVAGFSLHGADLNGIEVAGADRVTLEDLVIGLTPAGGVAAGNGGDGINVDGADPVITTNVVSANNGSGIRLGAGATGALVDDNRIGTDIDGTGAFGNGAEGIRSAAVDGIIGQAGTGNVIVDATSSGIRLDSSATATVVANRIGVDRNNTVIGVGTAGIVVTASASATIGGVAPAEANVIRGAGGDGVRHDSTGSVTIMGNAITGNGQLAIDLAADEVTLNDAGDVDTGANGLLNFPVLTAPVAGDAAVAFDLDVPAGDYRIEIFTNASGADPSGYGEGETLVAAETVTHTGSGAESFLMAVPLLFDGDVLTATATADLGAGSYGATSEFSAAVTVAPAAIRVEDASVRRSDVFSAGELDPVAAATTGPTGAAITFDGVDDTLVGPGLDVVDGALSLSALVRPDTLTGTDTVVSKRTAGGAVIYELVVDGTADRASVTMNIGGSPVTVAGGSLTATTWHQLVAVWDGTDLILYVDGAEVGRSAATGSLLTDATSLSAIANTVTGSAGFDGAIDGVLVEHRARTGAEIALEHLASSAPTTLISIGQQQSSAPGAWSVSGGQTRSGSFALSAPQTAAGTAAWAVATGVDEPGVVFDSWWWSSTTTGIDLASGTRAQVTPTDQFDAAAVGGADWQLRRRSGATTIDNTGTGAWSTGTWTRVQHWTDQFGYSRLFVDGVEVMPWTLQATSPASGSVALRAGALGAGQNWFVDDARARKLVMPEPTVSLSPVDQP